MTDIKEWEELKNRVMSDVDKMRDKWDEWEINVAIEKLREKTMDLKESIRVRKEEMDDIDPKNMENEKEEEIVNRLEVLYGELLEV